MNVSFLSVHILYNETIIKPLKADSFRLFQHWSETHTDIHIHTWTTCLRPGLWPTPLAHRPTPQQRAHPQSTVTKGKSWAQDMRLPLAARERRAQCFLQIAAVWAKPTPPSALYRWDPDSWGHHQCIQYPGWSWGLALGKVGVTVWVHSWVEIIFILFFPA